MLSLKLIFPHIGLTEKKCYFLFNMENNILYSRCDVHYQGFFQDAMSPVKESSVLAVCFVCARVGKVCV